jgi:hypothetical protein
VPALSMPSPQPSASGPEAEANTRRLLSSRLMPDSGTLYSCKQEGQGHKRSAGWMVVCVALQQWGGGGRIET